MFWRILRVTLRFSCAASDVPILVADAEQPLKDPGHMHFDASLRWGAVWTKCWQGFAAADDTWETEKDLRTQEGGRVAVGQYRARRQIVEALPAYKLRSRNGRNAPLPKLPFATTKRVADSLRSYELALKNV